MDLVSMVTRTLIGVRSSYNMSLKRAWCNLCRLSNRLSPNLKAWALEAALGKPLCGYEPNQCIDRASVCLLF